MSTSSSPLRVTVLGGGAIGSTVATALSSGAVRNAHLVGVVVRNPHTAKVGPFPWLTLDDALAQSDLVVECAGVPAVQVEGLRVIEAGVNLLISSVGALIDRPFRERMLFGGPGRCFTTTGAMGGLDVLAAASRDGGLSSLQLVSTKSPAAVVQEWMSEDERREVLESTRPVTVFSGSVDEAIRLFPRSLNVAVALALATDLWDAMEVTMVANLAATLTTHAVSASGRSGDYEFTMRHRPHPDNPATSGVVPAALLNEIAELAR